MSAKLTDPERDHAAQVVAKFSVLIRAWHTNNFHEAARVHDELERLGIRVQMPQRQQARKGVTDAQ